MAGGRCELLLFGVAEGEGGGKMVVGCVVVGLELGALSELWLGWL
jgi:hypothetical protein